MTITANKAKTRITKVIGIIFSVNEEGTNRFDGRESGIVDSVVADATQTTLIIWLSPKDVNIVSYNF